MWQSTVVAILVLSYKGKGKIYIDKYYKYPRVTTPGSGNIHCNSDNYEVHRGLLLGKFLVQWEQLINHQMINFLSMNRDLTQVDS